MKLSIIITVYNKEQYLRRALDALINQNSSINGEYEIIAVNDGSTDDSASILKEYLQRDNRVRILTQQNQGLSMARNNGVEPARGEYVWFVDADDTFSPNAVRQICEAMKNHPDVIPIYAETDGINKIRNRVDPNLHSGKDILAKGGWEQCGVFWVLRKEFLIKNNLSFFPGIYHEDAEFTPRMLYMAETAQVVPEVLYTVYRDPNSITQMPRPKRAYDCLTVARKLIEFFAIHNDGNDSIRRMMNFRISMIINDGLLVISKNVREERRKFDKDFRSTPELLLPLKNAPISKYRLEALLFRLFPGHYSGIYRLLKRFGK